MNEARIGDLADLAHAIERLPLETPAADHPTRLRLLELCAPGSPLMIMAIDPPWAPGGPGDDLTWRRARRRGEPWVLAVERGWDAAHSGRSVPMTPELATALVGLVWSRLDPDPPAEPSECADDDPDGEGPELRHARLADALALLAWADLALRNPPPRLEGPLAVVAALVAYRALQPALCDDDPDWREEPEMQRARTVLDALAPGALPYRARPQELAPAHVAEHLARLLRQLGSWAVRSAVPRGGDPRLAGLVELAEIRQRPTLPDDPRPSDVADILTLAATHAGAALEGDPARALRTPSALAALERLARRGNPLPMINWPPAVGLLAEVEEVLSDDAGARLPAPALAAARELVWLHLVRWPLWQLVFMTDVDELDTRSTGSLLLQHPNELLAEGLALLTGPLGLRGEPNPTRLGTDVLSPLGSVCEAELHAHRRPGRLAVSTRAAERSWLVLEAIAGRPPLGPARSPIEPAG